MINFAIKTAIIAAIPSIIIKIPEWIESTFDHFFGDTPPPKEPRKYAVKRTCDRTIITQYQYDYICEMHQIIIVLRTKEIFGLAKATQKDLTMYLNMKLNLEKSRETYRKIWIGKINRKSLPLGEPLFFDK